MSRYIDKDALLNKLQERHENLSKDYGDYDNYVTGFGDAIELLENAPAADVQEVKYAKDLQSERAFSSWTFECSRCHFFDDDTYYIDSQIGSIKYCPNCGAKIQDVKQNEKRKGF